ncbi:MAG: OmpA family protein [Coleofasciculus sp. G3-WIS-01]|uniref:OmpA family protein n=1 Tax=Coleofasciculus sp. G3-WIS-01 TaxID=3069528 RepID=UPI003302177E
MLNQKFVKFVRFVRFVGFVGFVGAKHSRPDVSIPQLNANSECFAQPQNKRKTYTEDKEHPTNWCGKNQFSIDIVKSVRFVGFVGAKHSRPDVSIPELNANSECFAQPQNKRKTYIESFLPRRLEVAKQTKSAFADWTIKEIINSNIVLDGHTITQTTNQGQRTKDKRRRTKLQFSLTLALATVLSLPTLATAQSPNLRVVVNSTQDSIAPDEFITLREAIELTNGQLTVNQLSATERTLVSSNSEQSSRIEFNLPSQDTTIYLNELLPPLATPGLVVDGTTQPGYDPTTSPTAEIAIPQPIVTITPTPGQSILRGLTIVADEVTVRGLSIYGFKAVNEATLATPPADIFISHTSPPPDISQQEIPNYRFPFYPENVPPQDVRVEFNWLGITPDGEMPENPSAFGVYVFNSLGTTVYRNRISDHEGSAIITSVQANNLQVSENIIVGNGINGMPDAIRLEGVINDSQITGNLICGNDGSGVYLFKPEGAVQIRDNQIIFNGRRLRRAAVYLMGNNHQVVGNQIAYQPGPGVVVTAYPDSDRNVIETNRFAGLEGLSIDLNTQQHVEPIHFQVGDGHNPPRTTKYQRQTTGNNGINAPQFVSEEFLQLGDQIEVFGQAEPGSTVELYRVREAAESFYGPLSEPIGSTITDGEGEFRVTLTGLQPGETISAIATTSQDGTSEPALNAAVKFSDGTVPLNPEPLPPVIPQCLSQTTPPPPPAEFTPPVQQPLTLRVPRNIHFALDRSDISPESAAVLDQVAAVLQEYPFLTIELQGHTDPRGNVAYNQALANRRALAVRNYLLRQGIDPEPMTIRSFGETQRRTTGSGVVDYARDRRVEIIFQDLRGLEIIFEDQETDLQIESRGGDR